MNRYENIVKELISHKTEEEWFEFKTNRIDAHMIGEYISALSNAAAIIGQDSVHKATDRFYAHPEQNPRYHRHYTSSIRKSVPRLPY